MIGIYRIVCEPTGRCYIGSSRDIARRWQQHRQRLEAKRHESRLLQRAWNIHGATAFTFEVIEECEAATLQAREVAHLRAARPTLNLNHDANGGPIRTGMRNSSEHKAKIAASHIGIRPDAAAREKMRAAKLGRVPWNKGKRLGPSWNKGRPWSEAERLRLSQANRPKSLTPEHKAKIAAGLRRWHALNRSCG